MTYLGYRSPVPLLLVVMLALAAGAAADTRKAASTESLTVGSLTLHRCETAAPWCGTLPRALDPAGAVPGTVAVYFEYYPHTGAGSAMGTLIATEGGPGYPATETREEYLALFEPLREGYDVLIMDTVAPAAPVPDRQRAPGSGGR